MRLNRGPMGGGGGGSGAGPGAGGTGLGRGGGAVSGSGPAPACPAAAAAATAWGLVEVDCGSRRSVAPPPLREGASGQVSAGGGPSARVARGADSRRNPPPPPRVLRGCPQPRPAPLGRGPARATPAALGLGCRGRGTPWGPAGKAGCRGPGEVGGRRTVSALRPSWGGGALTAAQRPFPAAVAPFPALPAQRWQQVQEAPGPSAPTGWGRGRSLSLSSARLCVGLARAPVSFLSPSLSLVVTRLLRRGRCGSHVPLSKPQVPSGVLGD